MCDLTKFTNLKHLNIAHKFPAIDNCAQLESLVIDNIESISTLPNLQMLKHLTLHNCPYLSELPTYKNLETLYVHRCPNLSPFLSTFHLKQYTKLTHFRCDTKRDLKLDPTVAIDIDTKSITISQIIHNKGMQQYRDDNLMGFVDIATFKKYTNSTNSTYSTNMEADDLPKPLHTLLLQSDSPI